MRTKISIKTPKGQATKTEAKIRKFLLLTKKPAETYTSPDDDEIIWVMEGDPRSICKITRNVGRYDSIISYIFNHKMMRKVIDKQLSKEDLDQLEDMLKNQTKVTIISSEPENPKNKKPKWKFWRKS